MKNLVTASVAAVLLTGCVSSKKYKALETEHQKAQNELSQARLELAACLEKQKGQAGQIEDLRKYNDRLIQNMGDLSTITRKSAENLERSLESISQKDLQIRALNEAMSKKDSITLALVTALKGELGNLDDEDVQISVDKGVVYVSLSDRMLFRSGSAHVSADAKGVLGKVANILKRHPQLEVMVEGHTDNVPIQTDCVLDNWDLSAKRSAAIVRILQQDHGVAPERLVLAGRSFYKPIAGNETAEGRAINRRTRILILPKLDEFFGLLEEGKANMK